MRAPDSRGFSLVELLVGMTFLMVSLLAIAAMFPMAYVTTHEAGKTTMTMTAARQLLEDVRSMDFDDLINLNGFDTSNPATLPADGTERELARRWRFALAGQGDGFTFTAQERSRWASLSNSGVAFGARGRIAVVAQSPTLMRVTVTISMPRRADRTMATLISRM
jgi:type II secretory pathway pseudopilin PulG